MAKDKKKKEEEKPKKNDFKSFLKKRAPIYLALIAMLVVFVIPEYTKGTLEKSFPEFSAEEQQVIDILMKYDGPNNDGLTVLEALENKIEEEYPNEKIYDHKKTVVDLVVTNVDSEEYKVNFNFKSHNGEMNYDWNVNVISEEISSNNPDAKYIIDLVNYYD
ncbi:hypothetical protein C5F47_08860 [Nitrosopumilus cobalaminigenes]|uniref:Uncharacterized protein n=1 Tax=Nitrosopumilus cobalaminigenes TaxID=1470066 RepID=A0A7D5R3E5_9ARCH|nr:hypothetical protein [Nitrosopumilus cobalaminigenes]QLH03639.1 hypothetical protein C5F47_08860 [Nitrosopumilus cobalaminigenes]